MRTSSVPQAVCLLMAMISLAQANTVADRSTETLLRIALPNDGDEYSKLVAQAAARDATVDFHALRFAYLKSAARLRNGVGAGADAKKKMFTAARAGDDAGVREAAEGLLSIRYVDPAGQAFLSRACQRLHDSACAAQADFVARGLSRSIMDSGDGKTCKTGWEVIAVDEEYFVLGVLGMRPTQQSLITGSPSCDVLDTIDSDGKETTYFFRVDAVLADEMSILKQK